MSNDLPNVGTKNAPSMANYTLTIVADSGYESTTEGRCSAVQYGAAVFVLHNEGVDLVALTKERDELASRVAELEGELAVLEEVQWQDKQAALRDAPQAEIDAITELNHAQWLALENVRTLAARNRKEEWAQHLLRWCTEAGNAARILRSTPSAPTAEWNTESGQRCPHCDGTGDVHSIDGQWRGRCYCPEGQASPNSAPTAVEPTGEEVSVVEPDERAEFEAWLVDNRFDASIVDGQYTAIFTRNAWLAWQARASKGTL